MKVEGTDRRTCPDLSGSAPAALNIRASGGKSHGRPALVEWVCYLAKTMCSADLRQSSHAAILIAFLSHACALPDNSSAGAKVPVQFYRYTVTGDDSYGIDTLSLLPFHDPADSLLGYSEFYWKRTRHVLRGFTSDLHEDVDGGSFVIELDSLGVIYEHSTTWPSFRFVRSNNDSISELITAAIAAAHRPGHLGLHYHSIWPEPQVSIDFSGANE